jgi:succinate dehydrogenase/fumarate reductase cytochrome b subunit
MKKEKYIQLAVFTYESEYSILKNLLDQKHIRYIFKNETIATVLPFHSHAFGGIRLMIHPEDHEEALKIYDNFNSSSFDVIR